jgi:ABC-type transport system substrate-binding protein
VLEPQELVARLDGAVAALPVFLLESVWQDTAPHLPCQGEAGAARQEQALQILAAAGYTWEQGPDAGSAPVGLLAPDGSALPAFSLLSPAQEYDRLRASAAAYIAQQARTLGIIVDVQPENEDSVLYAVYGSGEYDMALLGWQLGSYPAYLCAWFDTLGKNPFAYDITRLKPACDAWERTADLGQAQEHAVEVQTILAEDLPLIPLFVVVRHDAYRNVRYPFGGMIDGLADLYAAPELAVPFP